MSDEELLTAMVEVEGILNSHPLTYCSSDPDDEHVLTPNHFLFSQMGGQLPPRVLDKIASPEIAGDLYRISSPSIGKDG